MLGPSINLASRLNGLMGGIKVHYETPLNEEFTQTRKRSFSFDREQRLSRRESLVALQNENAEELMVTAACRRDSLSESNENLTHSARRGGINT